MGKKAFSLAEILITLTIIGVIAVLTIPNIMHKFQKTEWETRAKKTYALLNNKTKLILADKGCSYIDCAYDTKKVNWGSPVLDDFIFEIFPDAEIIDDSTLKKQNAALLNGTKTHLGKGSLIIGNDDNRSYSVPSADILLICFRGSFSGYFYSYPERKDQIARCKVATEYPAKKYIYGRNLFNLSLINDGRWLPSNDYTKSTSYNCKSNSTNTYNTENCFSKLMRNGWKMDY